MIANDADDLKKPIRLLVSVLTSPLSILYIYIYFFAVVVFVSVLICCLLMVFPGKVSRWIFALAKLLKVNRVKLLFVGCWL